MIAGFWTLAVLSGMYRPAVFSGVRSSEDCSLVSHAHTHTHTQTQENAGSVLSGRLQQQPAATRRTDGCSSSRWENFKRRRAAVSARLWMFKTWLPGGGLQGYFRLWGGSSTILFARQVFRLLNTKYLRAPSPSTPFLSDSWSENSNRALNTVFFFFFTKKAQ